MKKVLYFASFLLCMGFMASCEKDDIEKTSTVSMAGQWYCTIDAVDDNGDPIPDGENYFGLENPRTLILTYNTSANSATEMWIDNLGVGNLAERYAKYWKNYGFFPSYTIKSKVNIDTKTLTFSCEESENLGDGYIWYEEDEEGNVVLDDQDNPVVMHEEKAMAVTITEGKILKGAGRQNNGSPADSIIFYVSYKDDPWYPDDGYAKYRVSGIRYSGLVEND